MYNQANALFVLYTEATMGAQCDAIGSSRVKQAAVNSAIMETEGNGRSRFGLFFSDPYHNDPKIPEHYQGEVASVLFDSLPAAVDLDKKIKSEINIQIAASGRSNAAH